MLFPWREKVGVMLPLVTLASWLEVLIVGLRVGKMEDKAQSSVGTEVYLVSSIQKASCPYDYI